METSSVIDADGGRLVVERLSDLLGKYPLESIYGKGMEHLAAADIAKQNTDREKDKQLLATLPPEFVDLLEAPAPVGKYQQYEERKGLGRVKELRDTLEGIAEDRFQIIVTPEAIVFSPASDTNDWRGQLPFTVRNNALARPSTCTVGEIGEVWFVRVLKKQTS